MSDSKVLPAVQIPPVQQQTQTLNFEIKKLNSAHEILETIKKQCVAFQSFSELQQACFQNSNKTEAINQALNLFLRELTQTLSCMILNAPNSKVKDKEYFLMENLALLEDKILKDEQTFQETCRIYYNIQNLTENSTCEPTQNWSGERQTQRKNTQKVLKPKIKKIKSKCEAKKSPKLHFLSNSEPEKVLLRLIPHTTETHQIMMKLENFPRLELKVSPNNFLRNINDHLTMKWLSACPQTYLLDFYPDESKWLKNINIDNPNPLKSSTLSENFMISDIFSAYDCPQNKVVYIFYDLREKIMPISRKNIKKEKSNVTCERTKKEENLKEEKTPTISTTPNNSKDSNAASEENSTFTENLLRKIKEQNKEIGVETYKNEKEEGSFNFIGFNGNSKPVKMENSGFSFNQNKKSVNFSNFSASGGFLKQENSDQKNEEKIEIVKKEEGVRKDLRHLNKIKDLVDIVGKKYEKMQKK